MQKVVSLSPHPATFPYLTTLGSGWESLGLSWPGPGHPLAMTLGIQTKARETPPHPHPHQSQAAQLCLRADKIPSVLPGSK